MFQRCPKCAALLKGDDTETGDRCPGCGVIFAKYQQAQEEKRARAAGVAPAARTVPGVTEAALLEDGAIDVEARVDDPDLEWKLCVGAIPIALVLALMFHAFGIGHFLQRTFLSMPVHELGHAVAAWFCGFAAIPTVWKTLVPESRGFIFPLAMLGGLGYMMYRAHLAEKRRLLYLGCVLVLLQAIGTLGLKTDTARMVVIFAGDGAGMVLGTLLMASFFFGKDTQLYKGWLRWGFLVIGAAAFVDMYATWWTARDDLDVIPFGVQDGSPTDPSALVDEYGWTAIGMVRRYVALGVFCLLGLALAYGWGVWQAKQKARDASRR